MFAFLCVLFNALHADKTRERCFHIIVPFVIGIVGFIIGAVTQNLGARFFALFIQAQSYAVRIMAFTKDSQVPEPLA